MCVFFKPARPSSTILLAHSLLDQDNQPINVTGYGNKAQSIGPNAMLLPIPAVELTAANCVDMSKHPDLFVKYRALVLPQRNTRSARLSKGGPSFSVEVFDSGSYRVLLSPRASLLPNYLGQVPENKRPAANPELLAQMDAWYPDFWFALCCWDGEMEAEPMVWWYKPLPAYRDHHFLPGLDAHDGGLPKIGAPVEVDHTIVIGRPEPSIVLGGNAVQLTSTLDPAIKPFMPNHVWGLTFENEMQNGDWRVPKGGKSSMVELLRRVPPPGA